MRLLNNFSFDEEAVSPVVGVILMVAITVILAAVIGTFVLDLGGQVQQNAQAGVTFDENEGVSVTVQLNSIQSADYIYAKSSASGSDESDTTLDFGGVGPGGYSDGPTSDVYLVNDASGGVGTTVTFNSSNSGYATGETISVIGVLDGSENIIQTYEMGG